MLFVISIKVPIDYSANLVKIPSLKGEIPEFDLNPEREIRFSWSLQHGLSENEVKPTIHKRSHETISSD